LLRPSFFLPPSHPPCRHFEQAEASDLHRASLRTLQAQVLDALSPALKQEVLLATNARVLARSHALRRLPPAVQAAVAECLRRQVGLPGEVLALEGAPAAAIAFLVAGHVRLSVGGRAVCEVGAGSYFGDVDVLCRHACVATVQALRPTEMYCLPAEHALRLCAAHPVLARSLRLTAAKRLQWWGRALGAPLQFGEAVVALAATAAHRCCSRAPPASRPYPLLSPFSWMLVILLLPPLLPLLDVCRRGVCAGSGRRPGVRRAVLPEPQGLGGFLAVGSSRLGNGDEPPVAGIQPAGASGRVSLASTSSTVGGPRHAGGRIRYRRRRGQVRIGPASAVRLVRCRRGPGAATRARMRRPAA